MNEISVSGLGTSRCTFDCKILLLSFYELLKLYAVAQVIMRSFQIFEYFRLLWNVRLKFQSLYNSYRISSVSCCPGRYSMRSFQSLFLFICHNRWTILQWRFLTLPCCSVVTGWNSPVKNSIILRLLILNCDGLDWFG